MKTKLSEFIAHVKNVGLPTATHFFVYIPGFGQYELAMCDSTSLPGIQIMSSEVRMFGELHTLPHAPLYQTHQLSFIADNKMTIRDSLEKWSNEVFNRETRKFGYYDQYTKDVTIYLTDKAGKVIYAVKLREAWLQQIGDTQLDYGNESLVRIPVTLAYKWWEAIPSSASGEPKQKIQELLNSSIAKVYGSYYQKNPIASVVQNEFMTVPEKNGFATGVTNTGTVGIVSPSTDAFTLAKIQSEMRQQGIDTTRTFNKSSNNLVAAVGSSGMNPTFTSQIGYASQGIAKHMGSYGVGLSSLAGNLLNISGPIADMSTAVSSVGGTLMSIDSALATVGISPIFAGQAQKMIMAAGGLSQVGALKGLPGQLYNVGANMGATGALFEQATSAVRGVTGSNSFVEDAMRKMGTSFTTTGTNTMNSSNVLANLQ